MNNALVEFGVVSFLPWRGEPGCCSCGGTGNRKVRIPIEQRSSVCYDHWDKYDYPVCWCRDFQ